MLGRLANYTSFREEHGGGDAGPWLLHELSAVAVLGGAGGPKGEGCSADLGGRGL